MGEAQRWRERAVQWRAMAEVGDDPYLRGQLLELAAEADAVAAELMDEERRAEPTGGLAVKEYGVG